MGEKYGVYWKGKLVDGPFDTEPEAQTFINIKSTEMELGDYTPSELEKFLKIKKIPNPASTSETDRRSEIFRQCMREAGYGVHSETVLKKEIRKGDVGVLEWAITAENTAGLKHTIPARTEVRVAEVRVAYTSFYTKEAIGGQTYFTSPNHEFIAAFRKRGTSPTSWGERPGIISKEKHEGGSLHKMALTMEELQNELNRFTGTENYYRHFTGGKFTDGVKHLADRAGAYWLIDAIFSYQGEPVIKAVPFQIWTLKVLKSEIGKDKSEPMAVLEMRADTDHPVLVSQKIPFTDFPEGEFKLYYQNDVLFLPSEY